MKCLKVHPTYIALISVLNACAHAGQVEEGRTQFNSMISDYGIEPRVKHYGSLVDIVGACRAHNNVELAQVATQALIRLEPESSAPYVLLYNMYADLGR
ncbi:hypothetical protein L6164_006423 [Bauhinia variegata]|nr:hypothetical protein L6164_006423 [Bauhinia variegata]